MGVVSPGRKMAGNFVLVRGYICYCLHLSVLPTPGKYFWPDKEKFGLRRKISVAVAKLCFEAEIPAGLATLMFDITEDPLKKNGAKF
jgi:hypothetical protein